MKCIDQLLVKLNFYFIPCDAFLQILFLIKIVENKHVQMKKSICKQLDSVLNT